MSAERRSQEQIQAAFPGNRKSYFDNAPLALSFYRDGGDWTSGKIAMRSPRTEPSQSSLAT
jgi:hypothetical protein